MIVPKFEEHTMAKIPYKIPPKKVLPTVLLISLFLAGGGYSYEKYKQAEESAALALDVVEEFEGYVPEGYKDPVGIPTKCWGDTRNVVLGKKYSFDECARSLTEHMAELVKPLTMCIHDWSSLPGKTKAAIASMTYNIGSGAMCKSSVVQRFNAGDWGGACRRMSQIYRTAKGKLLPGLVRRRNYESEMCLEGLVEVQNASFLAN